MEGTTLLDDNKKDNNENHKRNNGKTEYCEKELSSSVL